MSNALQHQDMAAIDPASPTGAQTDLEHDAALPQILARLQLVPLGQAFSATVLTGGVSSDIVLIETPASATAPARRFCLKRALARLKVAALWQAPVSRNAAEAAWLRQVGVWLPAAVPRVLAEDSAMGLFAMDYLPSDANPVWKAQLASGTIDADFAAAVGHVLGTVHQKSSGDAAKPIAARFAHDRMFESIRLEPYLRATALKHVDLAAQLHALADRTLLHKMALVHGDVSPKNILCHAAGPVFLDAECAWYGDPAFDLAFCLNHLLLKTVWQPQWQAHYTRSFYALKQAYWTHLNWESPAAFEARCASLLPALCLARVDGKSPVEYLQTAAQHALLRRFARSCIADPRPSLAAVHQHFLLSL